MSEYGANPNPNLSDSISVEWVVLTRDVSRVAPMSQLFYSTLVLCLRYLYVPGTKYQVQCTRTAYVVVCQKPSSPRRHLCTTKQEKELHHHHHINNSDRSSSGLWSLDVPLSYSENKNVDPRLFSNNLSR